MKSIFNITCLLILITFNHVDAQFKYKPNSVLDKFVGTWIAQTDNKSVTIKIVKTKILIKATNDTMDFLEGYHMYKNGKNTIDMLSSMPTFHNGINISEAGIKYDDCVFFDFFDNSKHKGGKVKFILSKDDPNQLQFYLSNGEVFIVRKKGDKPYDYSFTLPTSLIFKKQL